MAATNKRKLEKAETSASKRRRLNDKNDDSEMKLNQYLKKHDHNPPLLCPITLIKNYLSNRKDILFPITDMVCVFIAGSIDYLCAEIIEVACNCSNDWKETEIRPIHLYYAIHCDDELSKTFKQKLIQFMYPIITKTCCMFYHFMDKENTNSISYEQFHKGMTQLKLNNKCNTKSMFDNINVGKADFVTIQDWKNYLNENSKDLSHNWIIYQCCICFDILNQSAWKQAGIKKLGLSEFVRKYSSSNEDEVQHRMNVITDNIKKYIRNETDQSIYHHKNKNNEKGDDDTKYILTEYGLYRVIFKYLSYEDILNGVYQIKGMLHQISLSVLDETYSEFVFCRMLHNAIYESFQQMFKEYFPLHIVSKHSFLILNALLMDMMNKIIKEINIKYTKCTNEEHEFCHEDMKEILENAGINGALCSYGCSWTAKIINTMLNFKENMLETPMNREINEFIKNIFTQ